MHWLDLKTPVVRDLAWAGFAAPLLQIEHLSGQKAAISSPVLLWEGFWQETLARLDHDPAPLLLHLEQRRGKRLGLYFESLWHFLLGEDPQTEVLATNLPVHENGRTVGEFDCLYYCARREQSIHLELAVKYYLGNPADGTWLGPGCNDHLDRKLDHLLQQQIRLSRHSASQDLLAKLGATEPALEIGLKGYLFSPPDGPMTIF